MNATNEGHEELLRRSGATIDLREKLGRSGLIITIEQNQEMGSRLLEKGAAVNLVQNDGSSALTSASTNGNVKIFARK